METPSGSGEGEEERRRRRAGAELCQLPPPTPPLGPLHNVTLPFVPSLQRLPGLLLRCPGRRTRSVPGVDSGEGRLENRR